MKTQIEKAIDKDSGPTSSIWMATAEIPPRPALAKDIEADVCVVGAGIADLTTAYLLADEANRWSW